MKRLVIWIMLLAVLTPTAALAAEKLNLVVCKPQDIACVGTAKADRFGGNPGKCPTLNGKGGDDEIKLARGSTYCWATLKGDTGNDRLVGKQSSYRLYGGPGNDYMRGGTLGDQVNAGPGRDVVTTGSGNDYTIRTQDGEVDRVSCGDGNFDRAIVDEKDIVSNDCEMTPGQ